MDDLLFPKADLPRKKPAKRMYVADAGLTPGGEKIIQFVCRRCGHDTDWLYDRWTITENKRGLPCPNCN
ncbi:MAG: hypothetical protein ABF479_00360 [Gluconacetobacter sp.]